MKLLFLALLVAFPFGQLARLPLNIPSVNIYFHDLIIVLILLTWLGWHLLQKKKIKLPPLIKPILAFTAAAGFSLALAAPQRSPRELLIGSLYLFRWLAYAGLYFVTYDLAKRLNGYQVRGLLAVGVASAVLGLLQYLFLPDTRFLYYSGWDDHYYRLIGTFLDPGFTGIIYVLGLILLVATFWNKFLKKKPIYYLLFIIYYSALALTYSRSAYLAYLVGMGVIAWKKKAPKFLALILGLFLITLLLLPRPSSEGVHLERKASVTARASSWQKSLEIIKDHPLLGVGFNLYRYAQRDYGFLDQNWQVSHSAAGADNSLLFVLATTGVIGLIAYLWIWSSIISDQSLVIIASFLALLTHSFFNNSLFYPWIMIWMWILAPSRF